MKKIIVIMLLFGIDCCQIIKFGEGVKNTSKANFEDHKKYMQNISFEGSVCNKLFCENCNINRYQLKIELRKISKEPEFGYIQYPPYYQFADNNKTLIISVSGALFENVNKNEIIIKDENKYYLLVEDRQMKFLSNQTNMWLE